MWIDIADMVAHSTYPYTSSFPPTTLQIFLSLHHIFVETGLMIKFMKKAEHKTFSMTFAKGPVGMTFDNMTFESEILSISTI